MRIISGYARGLSLSGPKNNNTRPTTDRIRESIFAILGSFEDCVVLDGFAGTGAMGCEALSRGADFVYFFDKSASSVEVVEENVAKLEGEAKTQITKVSFERGLSLLKDEPDIVFLDPPYNKGLAQLALEQMASCAQITSRALIVVEQGSEETPVEHPEYELDDERVYGSVRIQILLRR